MVKIYVEMSFNYGGEDFCGECETNNVDAIRHMVRFGYGKIIGGTPDAKVEAKVVEKAEKKAPAKKTTRKKTTTKKGAQK